METKVSKAQLEVWEAKDKLYEELKYIPIGKRIEYIQSKVKNTINKYFKNKISKLQVKV